jgi:hypothetical protein
MDWWLPVAAGVSGSIFALVEMRRDRSSDGSVDGQRSRRELGRIARFVGIAAGVLLLAYMLAWVLRPR